MLEAHAAGLGTTLGNIFSISGFGTFGVVHSNEELADFTSTAFKPNGAGYTHDWSADVDSILGVQLNAQFIPHLSAVVQVVTQQQFDNSYSPTLEWANIEYQPTSDFDIRVGRTVMPVFAAAQYWHIGYVNPWVRPPTEFYGLEPLPYNDGVDASYRFNVGDYIDTLQVYYGNNNVELPAPDGDSRGRNLYGITDSLDYGHLTLRIAFQQAHLSVPNLDSLFDLFRQFGAQGAAIANQYNIHDKPFSIEVIGATYDPGRWFVMSELGHTTTHFFLGDDTAWYVTAGFRYSQLTPYATYSQRKASAPADRGLNVAALPATEAAGATAANAALNEILAQVPIDETLSIGARWDFYRNFDLKVQYDYTRLGPGSDGVLINVQPGFRPGSTVSLTSAAVDFLF